MCGINGFNFKDEKLINNMNHEIKHRGPNDSGILVKNKATFGQVRLSIIDLTNAGHQPMFYDKKVGASNKKFKKTTIVKSNVSIIFNGEIYNYIEIKDKLLKKGYKFSTESDTEVILASYMEWGESCVEKFNGMWAFCIYDMEKNILFCSRDRLGVKPFYYYYKDGKFIFSSELKGILAHKNLKINLMKNINKEAVELYFALGYIPAPYSIFNNIYKLQASFNLVFDLETKRILRKYQYYRIPDLKPVYDKKKLINEGRKLLESAVKIRMRSDVPVGAFLSGGLDSSSVVGEMKNLTDLSKLHTFSIGFEGEYDETKFINIVKNKFKTKHHHYYFNKNDFKNLTYMYSDIYNEPFGDYSGFPTYKVSELAKKHVTVCLSGDGGDEIFGGYNMHKVGAQMDLIKKFPKLLRIIGSKIPAKKNLNSFASLYLLKKAFEISLLNGKFFYSKSVEEDRYKPRTYKLWSEKTLGYSLKKGNNSLAEGFRIHDLFFNTLADNFCVKVDRASMANALEVRSPFLDYRFIEFAQKIPTKWKTTSTKTKVLMREIIKNIVPVEIVKRGKQGFQPPIDKWILDREYEKELKEGLSLIKNINLDLFNYFNNKVFKETNKVYINDKIRLFLFLQWGKKWII